MPTEQRRDQPVLVSEDRLKGLVKLLPKGATALGGLVPTGERRDDHPSEPAPSADMSDCVIVISAGDDHTIHRSEICGGGTDFEIVSDVVVGSW